MYNMYSEEGYMKYVIVTGATGGMGESTVNWLLNQNYHIIAIDKIINEYENTNNVIPIKCDITNPIDILNCYEEVQKITNKVYAIVHLAGIYLMDSLVEIEYEKIKKIFDVNFFGVYLLNKTFLPLLDKGSKIVTVTSELAPLDPLPFTGIYGITKSTLDKYCYSLRMELQLLGIDVAVIRAGAVKTKMLKKSTDSLDQFTKNTRLYSCNAERFKNIIDRVETKSVEPIVIAKKISKILECKNPRFAYKINCNLYLKMLNIMPKRFQFWIIRLLLK